MKQARSDSSWSRLTYLGTMQRCKGLTTSVLKQNIDYFRYYNVILRPLFVFLAPDNNIVVSVSLAVSLGASPVPRVGALSLSRRSSAPAPVCKWSAPHNGVRAFYARTRAHKRTAPIQLVDVWGLLPWQLLSYFKFWIWIWCDVRWESLAVCFKCPNLWDRTRVKVKID